MVFFFRYDVHGASDIPGIIFGFEINNEKKWCKTKW